VTAQELLRIGDEDITGGRVIQIEAEDGIDALFADR
jgi:hypothetical protein